MQRSLARSIRYSLFAIRYSLIFCSVRKNPDREPWRDRLAGAARLQGARHRDRRGAFDRRRRRDACAARRRERVYRPAAGEGQLSQHFPCSPPARSPAPTRCIRATAFSPRTPASPKSSASTAHFIGPSRSISAPWATRSRPSARRSGSAFRSCRAPRAASPRRAGARDRQRDRLSGAGEGGGGRRRTRHEGGALGGRTPDRARHRPRRSQGRVRR